MKYIKNAAQTPCTRCAESKSLSKVYKHQSAIQRGVLSENGE